MNKVCSVPLKVDAVKAIVSKLVVIPLAFKIIGWTTFAPVWNKKPNPLPEREISIPFYFNFILN